ncbi:MAG: hypothetical protein HKN42_18090, partial [Granulosicoccus sp.]|nr:hypothetical protein [Granulosicoccus sp.]
MKSDYGRALLLLLLLAPDWALSRTPRHSPDEGAIVQSNSDLAGEEQVEAAGQAQAVEHTELTLPRSISLQRRPVWEVGVGGGYFSGFDYPASSDSNQRFVALPFFIYRTPKFRFGDGGVRAVAIERPTIKLDLSVGGSLNASSEGNSAREGMPNLDFLFEIGPQLEISLFERAMPSGGRVLLRFTSEVRAVLATDFGYVAHRGFVAEAGLGINYRNVRRSGIDLLSAVDVTFADERLQDYFYQVDPAYVNEQRPLYDASGGYLET